MCFEVMIPSPLELRKGKKILFTSIEVGLSPTYPRSLRELGCGLLGPVTGTGSNTYYLNVNPNSHRFLAVICPGGFLLSVIPQKKKKQKNNKVKGAFKIP